MNHRKGRIENHGNQEGSQEGTGKEGSKESYKEEITKATATGNTFGGRQKRPPKCFCAKLSTDSAIADSLDVLKEAEQDKEHDATQMDSRYLG